MQQQVPVLDIQLRPPPPIKERQIGKQQFVVILLLHPPPIVAKLAGEPQHDASIRLLTPPPIVAALPTTQLSAPPPIVESELQHVIMLKFPPAITLREEQQM